MTISPSATSAGKGDAGPRASAAPRSGAALRQRKPGSATKSSSSSSSTAPRSVGGNAGMWRFYTEDSPGLKV